MSAQTKKQNTKVLAHQKRSRRRVLTFMRMVRYGVNNFSRNSWLTIAATAVMTITLLIIFTTVVARQVLTDTVVSFRDKVTMSIYLANSTTPEQASEVATQLRGTESVREVALVSPDQARAEYIEDNKSNPQRLDSLNNADPQFPWKLEVKIENINDTSRLQSFVETNELYQTVKDVTDPSFAGPYKKAIEQVGSWVVFADRVGLIAGIVFVVISSLIIFNTIRMAIFNRREEIQMMKLIGAEKAFIRGPFIVEAVMYGFFAALFATGLGVFGVVAARPTLEAQGIVIGSIAENLVAFVPFVLVAMIIAGAIIGIISSFLATQRYLKI